MKFLKVYLFLLVMCVGLNATSQSRNVNLTISVNSQVEGFNPDGLQFTLIQSDYSATYPSSETRFNAEGKCAIKVYAGNHRIKIEKAGFTAIDATFNADKDMTVAYTLTEEVTKPYALQTSVSHDPFSGKATVTLTWNKQAPLFYDDFESYDAFTINPGPWSGIDGDLKAAAALTGSYPNRGNLQYVQIINPLAVDPVWWYDYPVLRPASGQQYAGFIRTADGTANNDWLISPTITLTANNIVRFLAKAADVYKEKFEVGISTLDNPTANDFTIISAGNYESVGYESWSVKSYDLSAWEGQPVKIGIHYIGEANRGGAFMLMVDDFYVGTEDYAYQPKAAKSLRGLRSAANPNEHFEVYLNGNYCGTTDGYEYTFNDLTVGTYVFGVKAKYLAAESEMAETNLVIDASDYCSVTLNVSTNNGKSADGINVVFTDIATTDSFSTIVADDKVVVPYLEKGDYLVDFETDAYEAPTLRLKVDGDKQEAVALKEKIYEPFNITVDVVAGTEGYDAVVKWNQDLGMSDGFEAYDDFATGSFGEWTTIDNDKMPVYPIALGSIENIVTFPGSGTSTQPAAIAPLVFNPYKTVPAMAPYDPAVIAPEGDKSVIFFSPQMTQADKWLISPAITARNGYECRFTLKAYTSVYQESFEVMVSTDKNPDNFTLIDSINPPSDYWCTYAIDLSAYDGQTIYVALHYVSYDAFFAQADDFYIGPKESATANVGFVEEYEVSLDGNIVGRTANPVYNFANISAGSHIVGIRSIYASGSSSLVTYDFTTEGSVDSITAETAKVVGGRGKLRIIGGTGKAMVCDLSGKIVAELMLAGDNTVALPAGIYFVKTGDTVCKVIVGSR